MSRYPIAIFLGLASSVNEQASGKLEVLRTAVSSTCFFFCKLLVVRLCSSTRPSVVWGIKYQFYSSVAERGAPTCSSASRLLSSFPDHARKASPTCRIARIVESTGQRVGGGQRLTRMTTDDKMNDKPQPQQRRGRSASGKRRLPIYADT